MKKLSFLSIILLLTTQLFAISKIKIICDRNQEKIYLNGKFKSDCKFDKTNYILVKPGKYKIEIKKKNKDGSYYYYTKTFTINDNDNKSIEVKSYIKYTKRYYEYAINNNYIKSYWDYLKKYPNGKYAKIIKNILKNSWIKILGGNKNDQVTSIIQTKDGEFIVTGKTESIENGTIDTWIIKLDKYGNKIWDKTIKGGDWNEANSIIETKDGGFIVAGSIVSNIGWKDVWIIKLDKNGNKLWDKTFGGFEWDEDYSIIETKDGGFAIAGMTRSKGNGNVDGWVIKLDKYGNMLWDKALGGSKWDIVYSIIQTIDGGFIVAGETESKGNRKSDAWIMKLDKYGNKLWDKTFGRKKWDRAYSIIQTKNGEFVVIGTIDANDDIFDNNFWIIKLDKNGNKLWDKTFGNNYEEIIHSIIQTKDSGFVVAGNNDFDFTIIKFDKNGNILWNKTLKNNNYNSIIHIYSITQTNDGDFAIAGEIHLEKKSHDALIIKLGKKLIKWLK
jgi:hypothetical protein